MREATGAPPPPSHQLCKPSGAMTPSKIERTGVRGRPAQRAENAAADAKSATSTAPTAELVTLESLRARLGAPDERLRERLYGDTADVELADVGERVQSQSIIDDVPPFVAEVEEVLGGLAPQQRSLVKIPEGALALLVDETVALRRALAEHDAAMAAAMSGVPPRGALPALPVTQGALDRQDGRVLLLAEAVLRAFQAARRADPSIPLPRFHRIGWVFEARARASRPAEPPPLDESRSVED
jgi:hypothetical protein